MVPEVACSERWPLQLMSVDAKALSYPYTTEVTPLKSTESDP